MSQEVDPLTEARYTLRVRDGSGAVKVRTVAARNAAAAIARIEAEGFTLVALVTDDMNRFDQPIGNAGLTLTAWSKLRYTIRMGGLLRLLLMVVAAVGALVLLVLGSSAAQPTSGLVGLALLIMVPAISLWAKARPSPSALLQSAIHAFTRGDFTAAARDASKHVAAARALGYGELATGVGNLVIALAKAGRREEAEAAIEDAARVPAIRPAFLLLLRAAVHEAFREPHAALQCAEQMGILDPDCTMWRRVAASYLAIDMNDPARARAVWRPVLERPVGSLSAWRVFATEGAVRLAEGDAAGAVAELSKAMEAVPLPRSFKEPRNVEVAPVRALLALALADSGDFEGGREQFNLASDVLRTLKIETLLERCTRRFVTSLDGAPPTTPTPPTSPRPLAG